MKLINPFDRFKDKSFKPRSLFPASKMTRTSLPIGRVVPLYYNEMMAGDRIKLKLSQLTRFMPMSRPVMQNYEFGVGAFFVPYRSLDRFTSVHPKYRWTTDADLGLSEYQKFRLDARNFFNPDADPATRHHPVNFDAYNLTLPSSGWTGSLFDHLQYFCPKLDDCYIQADWNANYRAGRDYENDGCNGIDVLLNDIEVNGCALGWTPLYWKDGTKMTTDPYFNKTPQAQYPFFINVYDKTISEQLPVLPFYEWLIYNLGELSDQNVATKDIDFTFFVDPLTAAIEWRNTDYAKFLNNSAFADLVERVMSVKFGVKSPMISTEPKFDDVRIEDLENLYVSQLYKGVLRHCNASYNVTRFLAYHSIYSDWFLPEHFIDCDDYRWIIGNAYINYQYKLYYSRNVDYDTLFRRPLEGTTAAIDAYIEQIKTGLCMPVLLNKDRLTGCLPAEQNGDKTAMADTVEDNMYNRALAKFKQLINRIGKDYRDVHETIYGHRPDDNTLFRSQVIGFRSFDVQVGDVAQTTPTASDGVLGQFGGFAVSRDSMKPFEWTADEEGAIMVVGFIRPKFVTFTGKVPRDMCKTDYFDYLIPQFGGIGYQQITGREANPSQVDGDVVFGYEERYTEYMMVDNECSGYMRDSYKDWHSDLVDTLPMQPVTGSDPRGLFATSYDFDRVFVNKNIDNVLCSCYFDGTITRALPSNIRMDY